MLQTDPVKKLQSFAENNEQTQGKFTIADEKVRYPLLELFSRYLTGMGLTFDQEYNAFMRVDVSSSFLPPPPSFSLVFLCFCHVFLHR